MEAGPEHLDSGPTRSWGRQRLVPVLAVVLAVVAALVVLDQRRLERSSPAPEPSPTATRTRVAPNPAPTVTSSAPVTPVTTRGSGPLAADVPAGTLYARGSGALYTIDTRTGTVVRTGGVQFASGGSVYMVPTPRGVIIRSYDDVPGLRIEDGAGPVPLAPSLAATPEIFPGPNGRLWAVDNAYPDATARLVDARGRPRGTRLFTTGSFLPDGAGGLLLQDVGGVWQAHPGPIRRVTTGSVIATGRRSYLLRECDDRHRCREVLFDRATRRSAPLGSRIRWDVLDGTISPGDGRAALARSTMDGGSIVATIRLPEGRIVQNTRALQDAFGVRGLALWLSDRWLAVAVPDGVALYDADLDRVVAPRLPISDVAQLAWRPASD